MALTTYADIQDSIRRHLWDRDDMSGMIPDFIVMGVEARLNRTLRVRQMETSASITLTNGSGPLPTDYLAWRTVKTQDSTTRQLEWAEPDWAEDHYYAQTAAAPSNHFTIVGSTIKTYPTSSSNLTMGYYQKIPAIASNVTGNWITTGGDGDIYVYGAMVAAAPFLDDDTRLATWAQLFKNAVEELKASDVTGRYAKTKMRINGSTP
jgi:hypothetical protein